MADAALAEPSGVPGSRDKPRRVTSGKLGVNTSLSASEAVVRRLGPEGKSHWPRERRRDRDEEEEEETGRWAERKERMKHHVC